MWGFSFVAARVVLSTLAPAALATVRFGIASLIFAPIIVVEYRRRNHPNLGGLVEFALLGFLGISLLFMFQYTGVKYVGAGISALLVIGLIPILTGLMSAFFLKESYDTERVFGTLLGLVGVLLVAVPGLLQAKIDWLFYVGILCLVLNAACFALYSTFSRRLMKMTSTPLLTTSYVTVLGTLLLIPMSLSSDWNMVGQLRAEQWFSILYLTIGCSCAGFFLWNFALSTMEAVKVAVWQYLEPLVAFIGEAIIFGTVPTTTTILGGCAIIVGALITNWSGMSSKHPRSSFGDQ
jgi:drug/metabolite transporter (DMT)-like permease